jgi:uncharacterized delta-60 repeat protein
MHTAGRLSGTATAGRALRAAGAALALALAAPAAAAGAAGTLNASFGSHGIAASGGATRLFADAVEGDGKVVAAGEAGVGSTPDVLVARFDANGTLDRSFGAGGVTRGPAIAGAQGSLARAVAIQPDGKIVVVGKASDRSGTYAEGLLVERFNADGTLDRGFGAGGVVDLGASAFADGYAVALQPDGKILATGSIDAPGSGGSTYPRVAVARLNPNGSLDQGFRGAGLDVLDLGAFSYALAVALQSDGKIVIAGSQAPGLQVPNALIARLTPSGALDPGFAAGGAYAHQYAQGAASSSFNAVAVQPNGAIIAAGAAAAGQNGADALVVRFTSAGRQDGSFGAGGVVYSPSAVAFNQTAASSLPGIDGVTVAPGGDIVGAGTFVNGLSSYATLWAFRSNGAADTSFGSHGAAVLAFGGSTESEDAAVAISPATGDLLAAGDAFTQFTDNYAGILADYHGFGAPTPPPFVLAVTGVARSYKDATVARRGLRFAASCNQACAITVTLTVSAATARRLHLRTAGGRPVTLAFARATLGRAGSRTFTLRLSKATLRALERQRKGVGASLQVTASSKSRRQRRSIRKGLTFHR